MLPKTLALVLFAVAATHVASSFADGTAPAPARSPASAQPVAPTHDPDAVTFLRTLEATISKQTNDEEIASIKTLVGFWKDPAVKDETKKPIPGLVAWYARRKSTPVALAGIAGLADIGPGEGAQNLVALLGSVLGRDDAAPEVVAGVFAALKKVADPDPAVTDALVKLLVNKDNLVVAKAADTLGGYGAAPGDVRRDLLEQLIRSFEGVASQAQSQPKKAPNRTAMNKWATVGSAVVGAMNALAHQSFTDPAAARRWFNEHHRDADLWK